MATIRVRLFAAAREAAGTSEVLLDAGTTGAVLEQLTARHPDLGHVLPQCSVLVDGVRASDGSTPIHANSTVDVLPPFAGG